MALPQLLISSAVFVITVLITVDAARLGARRGALGGGFLDMGPVGWFFAGILLWFIAFPCYLVARPRLVRRARALPQVAMLNTARAGAMQPVGLGLPDPVEEPVVAYPPPASEHGPAAAGYYPNPDPSDGHATRWWDGQSWAVSH